MQSEDLAKLKKLRSLIIDVMIGSADSAALDSYTYGENDGTQSVRRRDPTVLMKWLDEVDKKIQAEEQKIIGGGLRTFGTNRYA